MNERLLATRIGDTYAGRGVRLWTLNDEQGHYHGVVDLSESPLLLKLSWRRTADGQVMPVGVYRLDLRGLLDAGFIRTEPTRGRNKVRVRVVRGSDGTFGLQARSGAPYLRLDN